MAWSVFTSSGALKTAAQSVGFGTSLPASPVDGQEYILTDSVSAPTYVWRFRYNNQSASAYKWEFIGGAPKRVEVATLESTATTGSWLDLATVGPSFTVPRAGDWATTMSLIYSGTTASSLSNVGVAQGAGTPAGSVGIFAHPTGTISSGQVVLPNQVHTGVSASVELRMRYNHTAFSAGTASFSSRTLSVVPVRVS
jgi:hypothetical protein